MEVPPPVVVRLPPPTTLLTHGSSSGSSDGGGWPGLGIGSGHQRQRQRITAGWKPQPQKLRRQARSVVGASAGVAGVAAAAASQQPQASLDSFAARGRAEGRSGMQGCRGAGSGDAPRLTLGLPESARGLALCMGGGGGAFVSVCVCVQKLHACTRAEHSLGPHAYMHACMHAYMRTCVPVLLLACMHMHVRSCAVACTHARDGTRTHLQKLVPDCMHTHNARACI
eukprot:353072-Chlamydomonas_euryale.AAC.9